MFTKEDLEKAFEAGGSIIPCVSNEVSMFHYGAYDFESWFKLINKPSTTTNEQPKLDLNPWEKLPKGNCDCFTIPEGSLRQCDCVGPS